MSYQAVFKRYELKYLLTHPQQQRILEAITSRMEPDAYGRTTIRNIYFDTASYRLIRRSLDKPAYKEKLRLRSYGPAQPDTPVFVELKKKYDGLVYQRRLTLPEAQAVDWIRNQSPCPQDCQIGREIDYFLQFYGDLRPTVFLSYDREAYYAQDGSCLRITFDENIRCRRTDLSLESPVGGISILSPDTVLMEVKCDGGMPLWLAQLLTKEQIYKTSYSKYGTAYQTLIYPHTKEDIPHAE